MSDLLTDLAWTTYHATVADGAFTTDESWPLANAVAAFELPAGSYDVSFDIADYTSGVFSIGFDTASTHGAVFTHPGATEGDTFPITLDEDATGIRILARATPGGTITNLAVASS